MYQHLVRDRVVIVVAEYRSTTQQEVEQQGVPYFTLQPCSLTFSYMHVARYIHFALRLAYSFKPAAHMAMHARICLTTEQT